MPKEQLEFFDVNQRSWESVPGSKCAGLYQRVLAGDPEGPDHTRMLKFEQGTDTTPNGVQVHDYWEEVYILEGSIIDLSLNQEFRAGMYACRPPGMRHGPWKAPAGCITFEVRYRQPTG